MQSFMRPSTYYLDRLKFSTEKQNRDISSIPSYLHSSRHFFRDFTPYTCPWRVEFNLDFLA